MKIYSFLDPAFLNFWYASNTIALTTWLLTLINNNFSQVDRIWSMLPVIYSWAFVITSIYHNPGPEPDVQIRSEYRKEDVKSGSLRAGAVLEGDNSSLLRLVVMACLISMWGCRLTYNYWRKGGFNRGSEDYRWEHVKKQFWYPTWKWQLFNLGFIAILQNWLLMSITIPMWFIQTNKPTRNTSRQEPFNCMDLLFSVLWLGFFAMEVIADRQQFKFQTNKYKYQSLSLKNKKVFREQSTVEDMSDYKRGFCTQGLFRYSRHPNFCGELGMWWTIAMFTVSGQYGYMGRNFHVMKLVPFNFGFIGVFCLTLLFHKSTELTEKITSEKYPDYREYQAKVSRIVFGAAGKMNEKKLD